MSLESVLNKCNIDSEEKKQLIIADMMKNVARFEKIVKASFNDGQDWRFWERMTEDSEYTPAEKKNEHFERNKEHFIKQYLTILCDYYDLEGK